MIKLFLRLFFYRRPHPWDIPVDLFETNSNWYDNV